MSGAFAWDADWYGIEDPAEAMALSRELEREVSGTHVLFGHVWTAIGRRTRDDVLFLLENGTVAQVRLTWHAESSPDWPAAKVYPDFASWQSVPPEDR